MRPFDENDLIAYHLQELSPRRTRALERALQTDPRLARDSAEVGATLQSFIGHTPLDLGEHLEEELVERNWQALQFALPKAPLIPSMGFRWNGPALLAGGIALATFSLVLSVRYHAGTVAIPNTSSGLAAEGTGSLLSPGVQADQSSPKPATASPFSAGKKGTIQREIPSSRRLLFASTGSLKGSLPSHIPGWTPPNPEPAIAQPSNSFDPAHVPVLPAPMSPFPVAVIASPLLPTSASDQLANKSKHSGASTHHDRVTDMTLAMGGTLIGTHGVTTNGITRSEGATHAINAIASFHQQFRPFAGYRITASYARPDFLYNNSNSGQQEINGRVYELAGTYVIQGPHRGRISTSVEAGAGVMAILATIDSPNTSSNTRAAAVIGVSADIALTNRLALHTAYRGQIFKGPDFRAIASAYPLVTSATLLSNEPSVGLTYRFSRKLQ